MVECGQVEKRPARANNRLAGQSRTRTLSATRRRDLLAPVEIGEGAAASERFSASEGLEWCMRADHTAVRCARGMEEGRVGGWDGGGNTSDSAESQNSKGHSDGQGGTHSYSTETVHQPHKAHPTPCCSCTNLAVWL